MDKKYNGFNNGRDKSDGVGGREVNHGTQETMTKEQTAVEWLIEELKSYGQYQVVGLYQSIFQLAKERELKQLSAERERAGKLVEALKRVDALSFNPTVNRIIKQTLNEYDTATKES